VSELRVDPEQFELTVEQAWWVRTLTGVLSAVEHPAVVAVTFCIPLILWICDVTAADSSDIIYFAIGAVATIALFIVYRAQGGNGEKDRKGRALPSPDAL
jgi:hypothetical protein